MEKGRKVPKGALRFVSPGQHACVFAEEGGEEKIQMTVYSGGVIENHWYWDNLIMDLEGVQFKQKVFPILEDHNSDRKIGFHKKPNVDENGIWLNPETSGFVDTPESNDFRKLSKQGFPFQSSLYGRPLKIQRFGEKEEVVVNGHKVQGPGTVWREWEFKESSVCVFGWDSKTKASAFSREETEEFEFSEEELSLEEANETKEGGETIMDLNELKTKYPDLFAQVIEEGKKVGRTEAENTFSAERQQFQASINSLEERTAKTEKELALAREAQLKAEADGLFSEMFAESDIEPRLEPKVRSQINHSKFVKDDKLDVVAFKKAIDEEIKDWESRLPSTGVSGFSNASDPEEDDVEADKKFSEQNKSIADDLLARVGQTRDK